MKTWEIRSKSGKIYTAKPRTSLEASQDMLWCYTKHAVQKTRKVLWKVIPYTVYENDYYLGIPIDNIESVEEIDIKEEKLSPEQLKEFVTMQR